MKLILSGKEENLPSKNGELSIKELLTLKQVSMPDMVTVELNEKILNRDEHETVWLNDGDIVEFLYFMGGGC